MKNKENSNSRCIYWREDRKKWDACVSYKGKQYFLAAFKKEEDAIKIRDTALQKIEQNCFEEWYNHELSKKKQQKRNCVTFLPVQKKWNTAITFNNKKFHLGNFEEREDAENIRDKAKEMIASGTFLEWYDEHRKKLEENNKAGHKGVYWNKNIWKVEIGYKNKRYYFGSFTDKKDAIAIYETARQKILVEDFEDWYEEYHKQFEVRRTQVVRNGVYPQKNGRWKVDIGYNKKRYFLGSFMEKEQAIKLHEIAKQKILMGIFEDWYENILCCEKDKESIINRKTPLCKGVTYNSKTQLYQAYIYYNKKKYSLCYSKDIKKVIDARKEAEQHVKTDFIEWFNNFKLNINSDPVSNEKGVYFHKKSETWFALIYYKSKKYNLGYFKNKDDAINIRKIAESYKNNGTFLEWFNKYKNLKKNRK